MPGTVLLIEDEPHIVEAISFLLERDGWHVQTHADGFGAVEIACSTVPDLIILDVMLPNKSGLEVLEEIREAAEISEIPVLILTAKGQAKDKEAAEKAGVSMFMTKPFSNQEILNSVHQLTQ